MIQVVISGYGKMGHRVEAELSRRGIPLVAASEDICAVDPEVAAKSVCIDFTTPEAFRANYPVIARNFKAAVVGTTGWNDISGEVFEAFRKAGKPLVYTANFSLGVNALYAALKKASALLNGAGYKASVEEVHHVHKLDAPSGTAKTLEAIVKEGLEEEPKMSAIRVGEVPGIHSVTLESAFDRLVFTHEAFSRDGFAVGAVVAALLTPELGPGPHEFSTLL
ncbi:MAG: 4-hydroxy-tetrahydrodipicolinate reductase [Bacteroidales bacterium]|nr:4-hydroxy-tetrahydrodipicolinate reductase [Bacteroidales bacterium]MBP5374016.1 4-hydroxy-tetrahydrodipicolinate reductase [Bacteroidales bacterium]